MAAAPVWQCWDRISGETWDVQCDQADLRNQVEAYLAEALCEGEAVAYEVVAECDDGESVCLDGEVCG
jgi:hypothetical protein